MQTNYHRNSRYGDIWKDIFKRDKNKCIICQSVEDLTLDHVVSVRKGGKSTMDNLRVLCRSCNTKEGQKDRVLKDCLKKKRDYMRKWAKKNPGYFTEKSREFRANNLGYYREINQEQHRLYMEAK